MADISTIIEIVIGEKTTRRKDCQCKTQLIQWKIDDFVSDNTEVWYINQLHPL
jgi:hypothetical protein